MRSRGEQGQMSSFKGTVVVTLIALTLLGVSLRATRAGPMLSPDSILAIGVAENALAGHGFTAPITTPMSPYGPRQAAEFEGAVPLTSAPPLWPMLLAAGRLVRLDLLDWAWLLNAVCFGLSLFLAGLLTLRLCGGAPLAAGIVMILVAFGPERPVWDAFLVTNFWLGVHGWVLSEPPFYVFCLAGLLALSRYLERSTTMRLIWVLLFSSCAVLTRFAGITVVATACLCIVFWKPIDLRRRIRDGVVVAVVSVGLLVAWLAYQMFVRGASAPRTWSAHPIGSRDLGEAVMNIGSWFTPWNANDGVLALACVVSAVVVTVARHLAPWPPSAGASCSGRVAESTARSLVVFVPIYLGFIAVVASYFDASAGFNLRLISIVRPIAYSLVVSSFFILALRYGQRTAALLTLCLGIALVAPNATAHAQWAFVDGANKGFQVEDQGRVWLGRRARFKEIAGSRVSQLVRRLPEGTLIVSNGTDRVYLETGRPAINLPEMRLRQEGRRNPAFGRQLQELRELLRERESVVVLFAGDPRAPLAKIQEALDLELFDRAADGALYRAASAEPHTTKPSNWGTSKSGKSDHSDAEK